MKISIRCNSLSMSGLGLQEKHGKRQDRTSKLRSIRDVDPLVIGSLNLRKQYNQHMDNVKQNAATKKPVLHFILRFPPEVLNDDVGLFEGDKRERQKMMVRQAVTFIQRTHGGDAVFAARMDLDEAGETIVDVFASPKYEKRTKRTKHDEVGPIWSSPTKYGKELAIKHTGEIKRRHPDAKHGPLTGPRMVGISLNSEFRDFFEKMNKITLDPKIEKTSNHADRLEIEAYKRVRDEEHRANRRIDVAEDQVEKERADVIRRWGLLRTLALTLQSASTIMMDRLGLNSGGKLEASVQAINDAMKNAETDIDEQSM
jgi:hypothetical protein